jgi:hypothetical protein
VFLAWSPDQAKRVLPQFTAEYRKIKINKEATVALTPIHSINLTRIQNIAAKKGLKNALEIH